jgi:Ser/Thr protein kinase RdoA (MazF antagonist)
LIEFSDEFSNKLQIDDVIQAFELLGFKSSGHCTPLNSLENRVFLISLEKELLIPEQFQDQLDGSSFNCVIKFYRLNRWTYDQILEEHSFLFELQEYEIPVIAPLKSKEGRSLFIYKDFYYAVWPNQKGRLVEEISSDGLLVIGRLLARIHNVGSKKSSLHRLALTVQEYGITPLNYLKANNLLTPSLMKRYELAAENIFSKYYEISKNIPIHRIHGDCHKGNLIKVDNNFCFIDFDDFVMGPAVQDFWMLLSFEDESSPGKIAFLEGYREFRDFSDSWFGLIEPLRGLRYIHYAAWVARRYVEQTFKNTFPHFGTEEYWERETIDLEKLGKGILTPMEDTKIPLSPEQVEEKELTNKDFFWDME